jgi:hypothetical protein
MSRLARTLAPPASELIRYRSPTHATRSISSGNHCAVEVSSRPRDSSAFIIHRGGYPLLARASARVTVSFREKSKRKSEGSKIHYGNNAVVVIYPSHAEAVR